MGKFKEGNTIAIRGIDGKYLSSQPNGMIMESTDLLETEHFRVSKVDIKTVTLTSLLDTRLYANVFGELVHEHHSMIPFVNKMNPKEDYFNVLKLSKGLYAFRNHYGRFLSLHSAENRVGFSKILSESCQFHVELIHQKERGESAWKLKVNKDYFIQTIFNSYMTIQNEDGLARHVEVKNPSSNEVFRVEQQAKTIHLKNPNTNIYLVVKDKDRIVTDYACGNIGFDVVKWNRKVGLQHPRFGFLAANRDGTFGFSSTMTNESSFTTKRV